MHAITAAKKLLEDNGYTVVRSDRVKIANHTIGIDKLSLSASQDADARIQYLLRTAANKIGLFLLDEEAFSISKTDLAPVPILEYSVDLEIIMPKKAENPA